MTERPVSLVRDSAVHELMETARAAPPGVFVEVGVYKGGTLAALAEVARERGGHLVFGFDTFAGIPYADAVDRHQVGDFGDTSLEAVQEAVPDAVLVPGIFPRTLGNVLTGEVALAHIDCDQFRSVRDSALALAPLMARGGTMVFDDYDVLEGAKRAVDELFGDRVTMSAEGKARVIFP